jgi:hypothetical protein
MGQTIKSDLTKSGKNDIEQFERFIPKNEMNSNKKYDICVRCYIIWHKIGTLPVSSLTTI